MSNIPSAERAVEEFMAKAGHHDTSVHERVAPAVVHETIIPSRHENVTTAIDKEIHQDHYHTSVQPIMDREVKPEKHIHNVVAVENREFEHGNAREIEQRLAEEAALFKDERLVNETKHTHSVAPVIAGEHIHHHVHETIQPVIQREVIAPVVVHTTVPIHEVHHNAAQHHATSALPAVSLADFKRQGGVLSGREERYDGFEGEPRSVGGHSTGLGSSSSTSGGLVGKAERGLEREELQHGHGSSSIGYGSTGSSGGLAGKAERGLEREELKHGGSNTGYDNSSSGYGNASSTGTAGGLSNKAERGIEREESKHSSGSQAKPSLMDRLNPMTDSNGDGKAGFMK